MIVPEFNILKDDLGHVIPFPMFNTQKSDGSTDVLNITLGATGSSITIAETGLYTFYADQDYYLEISQMPTTFNEATTSSVLRKADIDTTVFLRAGAKVSGLRSQLTNGNLYLIKS